MRILATGDFHGDTSLVEKLAEKAEKENVDLVIITGDMTMAEKSTDNLIGPFVKKNKKVLLIPGNHESFATADFMAKLYDVKNIHGYSVRFHDVGIFGCGGANIGVHQISEDEIFGLLKQGFDQIKYLEQKIMVTHLHPTGSVVEKFSQFVPGSEGVRKAIEKFKPKFLLCSHVHEAKGIEEMIGDTKVINVAKHARIIDI